MTRIPNLPRLVRGADHPLARDPAFVAATLAAERGDGDVITDHRTSWVRRIATGAGSCYVKVYEYSTWTSRLRDGARRTGPWARSRPAAEFDALDWLRGHGFAAPAPLLVGEHRRLGFLARAVLVTAAFAGEPVAAHLERAAAPDRMALARALGTFVGRLHALGFRDRNLDLRNLLARRDDDGWVVTKIDSPRFRLRPPGAAADAGTRADWARLLPQLARFGVDGEVLAAANRTGP